MSFQRKDSGSRIQLGNYNKGSVANASTMKTLLPTTLRESSVPFIRVYSRVPKSLF